MVPRSYLGPEPHPLPPDDLDARELPIAVRDHPWLRIHPVQYDALHYGRAMRNRFDAPRGEFGVLYAGSDVHCTFVESFGRMFGNLVSRQQLSEKCLSRIDVLRPLRLVDLTGPGLARLGADARLGSGDRAIAQRWSLAIWRHPSAPDGILYRSRRDPARLCAAVFDRASADLKATRLGSLLDEPNLRVLGDVLAEYGFVLIA
jgi:hypothetical protein